MIVVLESFLKVRLSLRSLYDTFIGLATALIGLIDESLLVNGCQCKHCLRIAIAFTFLIHAKSFLFVGHWCEAEKVSVCVETNLFCQLFLGQIFCFLLFRGQSVLLGL